MCTLSYTPMYYVWMFRRLQDSGPKLGEVQRPGQIHANLFTFYLNTENCEYQDQEHKTLQQNMHRYQH